MNANTENPETAPKDTSLVVGTQHFAGGLNDPAGWLLYDGDCPRCRNLADRFGPWLHKHGYATTPLQTEWVERRLAMPRTELLHEMRLLTREGDLFGGADAAIELTRRMGGVWSMAALFARIPPTRQVLHAGYRYIADRRQCDGGACAIDTVALRPPATTTMYELDRRLHLIRIWTPFFILTTLAIAAGAWLTPWLWMCLISVAMLFGLKWANFQLARHRLPDLRLLHTAAWFLLWPGMDATTFLRTIRTRHGEAIRRPRSAFIGEAAWAIFKIAGGVAAFWIVARLIHPISPWLAGWIGLLGLAFIFHFGSFHLLSVLWRRAGVDAQPLMNNPPAALSVAEFWGRRWNRAFRDLAQPLIFNPLQRRLGPRAGLFSAFAVSGLIHEIAISVPAGGGFGLPTLYFLIQAGALVAERSPAGRQIGLRRGLRGRIFTWTAIAVPAVLLFHPQFIDVVVLPLMHAAGAL